MFGAAISVRHGHDRCPSPFPPRRKLGFSNQHPIESIRNVGIVLHTQPKPQPYTLNIQDFAIQWITDHQSDFEAKQLTPRLHLDPFVSEITISPQDLRQMLVGICVGGRRHAYRLAVHKQYISICYFGSYCFL